MSGRICVICGQEPPLKDAKGNEACAYPKTEEEARIWQASMAATNCCLESIQNQCCVCVEHIPDFVKRAKKIGRKLRNLERDKQRQREEKTEADAPRGCQCPDEGEPGPDRPSVNVLLLNGASLPTYCGKGQSCVNLKQLPSADGDSELKITKRLESNDSDTEIFVQESEFKDTGGTFPDIDGTEVTVLRTPTQEEEQLKEIQKDMQDAEQEQDPSVRRCRNSCLPGCTDVLLLGRGHHPTDECPCKCEQCTKPSGSPTDEPCCQPECCPDNHQEYFTQPPCGCECEQQVRRELTKVIKTQRKKIQELEGMLCRQNNLRNCLQRKLDDLYCEFGRLDEDQEKRSKLPCSGGPDCQSVFQPPPPPPPPPEPVVAPQARAQRHRRITLMRANRDIERDSPKEEKKPYVQEPGERVHWFSSKNEESEELTHRPLWVTTAVDDGPESKSSIRFRGNTYLTQQKSSQSAITRNQSPVTSRPESITNSTYSIANRNRA
ncbi:uncharacterized protein LOC108113846 [Drosophila eugracilis]|uniref:uncharacterized protein LOC108113846 n=1 Tax=Drosophila eugracilis TaxID=29029 RepID=UPI0007E761AD|nr:uncharacterized protein LOC108113846 [Drosophila eugracilis]